MSSPWHHFMQGAANRHQVLQALSRAGVTSQPHAIHHQEGPGIVFCDQVNDDVCHSVRQFSNKGKERVLIVFLPGTSVAPESSWELLTAGASDVFAWDTFAAPSDAIAARFQRWDAVDRLVASPLVKENLVGSHPAWIRLLRRVVEIARFTDAPTLIMGETGTGKELIARLVHTLDPNRQKHELVIVDCTTIVPELSGSEFFGHERGSFTGAFTTREGAFALANRGTLFLDEVGELPQMLQSELLRAIQEHTYKRVGSNSWQQTDFRLLCATNRDLQREEAEGRFRRDFFYRIAGCVFKLPSLRERREDILPLTYHFLRQLRPNDGQPLLDQNVREFLQCREYPGNVRDLRQLVCRISHRHVGPWPITAGDIPEEERPARSVSGQVPQISESSFEMTIRHAVVTGIGLKEISRMAADKAISIAVSESNGNLHRAARLLKVTDRALQMRRAADRQPTNNGSPPPAPATFKESA